MYYFCFKFFSIKIGKNKFSFLNNGSDNPTEYQSMRFNYYYDKIIVGSNFTFKNILEHKIKCLEPLNLEGPVSKTD